MGKSNVAMVFVEETDKTRKEVVFATSVYGIVAEDGYFYGRKLSVSDLHEDGQMVKIEAADLLEVPAPDFTIFNNEYPMREIRTRNPQKDPRITILAESAVPKNILRGVTKEYLQFRALEGLWAERLRKAREQQAS
jgi:hypothetical protein